MQKKVFSEVETTMSRTHTLNKTELYVLRLILHGYSNFEIIDFLEIELDQFFKVEQSIKFKLGCTSWYKVIIKSFQLEVIKQEDFIDEIVKQQALMFSEKITTKVSAQKVSNKEVKNIIIEFYQHCNTALKQSNKENFSIDEREYLKLKFKGLSNDSINGKLQLGNEQIDVVREKVFFKLKVNDWYNNFKKAFQLDILKKEDYLSIDIELEAIDIAVNIISAFLLKNLSEKEKQLMVYDELLRIYTTIEFNYLSKALL
jgi:DNA-binding CsgD family transcriptional regulator